MIQGAKNSTFYLQNMPPCAFWEAGRRKGGSGAGMSTNSGLLGATWRLGCSGVLMLVAIGKSKGHSCSSPAPFMVKWMGE